MQNGLLSRSQKGPQLESQTQMPMFMQPPPNSFPYGSYPSHSYFHMAPQWLGMGSIPMCFRCIVTHIVWCLTWPVFDAESTHSATLGFSRLPLYIWMASLLWQPSASMRWQPEHVHSKVQQSGLPANWSDHTGNSWAALGLAQDWEGDCRPFDHICKGGCEAGEWRKVFDGNNCRKQWREWNRPAPWHRG